MKKLFLLIVLFVFISGYTLLAQTIVITGTVTSSVQGEGAIPGVTITVKGTTVGTLTDVNGKYSLTAPQNATTLVISYIGMKKQEVEIAGRKVIDAIMEPDVLGLSEVVVTAFGIKRQAKELGVATAQVSDKQLTQSGVSNVVNGLTAKVSGLEINTVNNGVNPDTRITLRGNRHFLASNQALIVLDGVPVDAGFLNSINPNDIGNVDVLKGASAAALYGNDASNGVLVITTKRGSAAGRPVIKVSNTTTFESVSYLPKLQKRFGSGSGEDTVNYLPDYTFWIGPNRNTDPYTAYENQCYGPEFNGQMVPLGGVLVDGSYQMIPYSYVPDGKLKFFNTGISTQNDISYSVGDDKNSFYLSAQDVNTTGTIPMDKNRRSGVRMSGSRTTGIFHADFSMGFTETNTNVSGGEYFQQRPVYWNVLNTPGEIDLTNYKDIVNNKFANPNGYFNAYYPNPYWQLNYSRNISRKEDLLGSGLISINPAPWIDISYRAGLTYSSTANNSYRDGVTYNSYMQGDPWQAGAIGTGSPFAGVSADQIYNSLILTGDLLVQLNKKVGDFTGKLILGNSMYTNKYRQVGVTNNSLVIPLLYNISNRLGEPGVGEQVLNRNSMGLFGDMTLGYKDFVFLHASARNDWDSRLSKANRSFFYPGVDASLILTDAIPALKDNAILSFAKVRGGWSKTGQISLANWYATLPSFVSGTGNNDPGDFSAVGFPYGSLGGYQLNRTLSNPNLKPEITQEIEAGFELSFIKSRIHLNLSGYQSKTKDQTIPATISYATGYQSAYINAGELQTQGIETDFKLTPFLNFGDFDWNITVNYTYQTSKVLSILPGLNQLLISDVSYAIVGQQFPSIQVTDVERDPQGHIIVDPSSGYPIKDPALKNMGHGYPNHLLGLTNTFTYKGFNLNIVAEYRTGNVIDNWVGNQLDFTGNTWHTAQNGRQGFVIPNSVIETSPGVFTPNTDVIIQNAGRLFWTNSDYESVQSTYLTSAAFWKLREISLSYDIPVKNILGGAIKGAQIGIVGRNLLMLRPKTNIWTDPEFNNENGTSNAAGFTDYNQTPPTRIYGFSVKLTF
jgi:TonB-linked outer membrane protein, SusC/RagA family/TonB-dependent outer membrane receptor, SusC/RagA subfamily, signature region